MTMAQRLLAEALKLDEEQRAGLALELMASISPLDTVDAGVWTKEIQRRADQALTLDDQGADVDEVIDRVSQGLDL